MHAATHCATAMERFQKGAQTFQLLVKCDVVVYALEQRVCAHFSLSPSGGIW